MTAPTLDQAYEVEFRNLNRIKADVQKRAGHYNDLAAAASVPCLLELLRQSRAALGPEWSDLAGRIDDALRGRS